MRVQSLTEIKPPADCRNAQLKRSAKQTRIPQQERRGVLERWRAKQIRLAGSSISFQDLSLRRNAEVHEGVLEWIQMEALAVENVRM